MQQVQGICFENHGVRVAMPRMHGEEGMFLFWVLRIIPVTRCVLLPAKAEAGLWDGVLPEKGGENAEIGF